MITDPSFSPFESEVSEFLSETDIRIPYNVPSTNLRKRVRFDFKSDYPTEDAGKDTPKTLKFEHE